MKRTLIVVAGVAALLLAAILGIRQFRGSAPGPGPGPVPPAAASWVKTSEGDFEESRVDSAGERIRLRAATRGTRDETVKFLGTRSARKFSLQGSTRVAARLDWNNQANGSYLSGSMILAPAETTGNPLTGSDWFKVEVIGVPPGQNARLLIACKVSGRERFLYTEGWPDTNRSGRKIALEEFEIQLSGGRATVLENGKVVFESKDLVVGFDAAYLYLQMSTHSNYPPRELIFDRISLP